MIWHLYSFYDPALESFDQKITTAPLDEYQMGEQWRRSFIKATEQEKAMVSGKKVIKIGTYDDCTGKVEQGAFVEVFEFKRSELKDKEDKLEDSDEEKESDKHA